MVTTMTVVPWDIVNFLPILLCSFSGSCLLHVCCTYSVLPTVESSKEWAWCCVAGCIWGRIKLSEPQANCLLTHWSETSTPSQAQGSVTRWAWLYRGRWSTLKTLRSCICYLIHFARQHYLFWLTVCCTSCASPWALVLLPYFVCDREVQKSSRVILLWLRSGIYTNILQLCMPFWWHWRCLCASIGTMQRLWTHFIPRCTQPRCWVAGLQPLRQTTKLPLSKETGHECSRYVKCNFTKVCWTSCLGFRGARSVSSL